LQLKLGTHPNVPKGFSVSSHQKIGPPARELLFSRDGANIEILIDRNPVINGINMRLTERPSHFGATAPMPAQIRLPREKLEGSRVGAPMSR
jgi:hypothetical protein